MIRSVRAGGVAAAVFAVAAALTFGTPTFAWQSDFAPARSPLDHARAAVQVAGFGHNGGAAEAAGDPVAQGAAAELAERMAKLAGSLAPRPRALEELVDSYGRTEVADAQQECLANAVYFEARGEPIEGQLAVAEVVLNRVESRKYPGTICEVVVQPWQFSFINPRTGAFPKANRSSLAWRKAVAIARIAERDAARRLSNDILWYHADYVAPGWGKRLNRETKIGLHIFYS
jgi:spore germination cell wall hydrolase CwlJ-like protein